MLPKKLRIKISEFNKNSAKYKKLVSGSLMLIVKEGNGDSPRFAISIPKKVDKRSTKRNATKRIIEKAIREFADSFIKNREILIKPKRLINADNRKEESKELLRILKNELC